MLGNGSDQRSASRDPFSELDKEKRTGLKTGHDETSARFWSGVRVEDFSGYRVLDWKSWVDLKVEFGVGLT